MQLFSKGCKQFSTEVCPDIKSRIVKLNESEEINQFSLLSIYTKLNLRKMQMILTLSDNIMVQLNHSEYDGSSLEKAYKLKAK